MPLRICAGGGSTACSRSSHRTACRSYAETWRHRGCSLAQRQGFGVAQKDQQRELWRQRAHLGGHTAAAAAAVLLQRRCRYDSGCAVAASHTFSLFVCAATGGTLAATSGAAAASKARLQSAPAALRCPWLQALSVRSALASGAPGRGWAAAGGVAGTAAGWRSHCQQSGGTRSRRATAGLGARLE